MRPAKDRAGESGANDKVGGIALAPKGRDEKRGVRVGGGFQRRSLRSSESRRARSRVGRSGCVERRSRRADHRHFAKGVWGGRPRVATALRREAGTADGLFFTAFKREGKEREMCRTDAGFMGKSPCFRAADVKVTARQEPKRPDGAGLTASACSGLGQLAFRFALRRIGALKVRLFLHPLEDSQASRRSFPLSHLNASTMAFFRAQPPPNYP